MSILAFAGFILMLIVAVLLIGAGVAVVKAGSMFSNRESTVIGILCLFFGCLIGWLAWHLSPLMIVIEG